MLAPVEATQGVASVGKMVRALHHRGPDGDGVQCVSQDQGWNLVLGHARLAILDLTDRAAQPMRDAATGSWLIYNGEIYNFVALRTELEAHGHRFVSSGDTEVLLKAFIQWGPSAMHRLRGMYAFAFWDGREKCLKLGRDPFGIKPLLVARVGAGIVFASEIRALGAGGMLDLHLNPTAVRSYLAFGSVIEPVSIFQEVTSIPPGHVVTVQVGGLVSLPVPILILGDVLAKHGRPAPVSRSMATEQIRAELKRSVSEHLVSDVPVGIFLSGGIDSSVIAALADQTGVARDMRYLTVCFAEQEFSELGYAQQVARQLSGRHETVPLDAAQMTSMLPRALASMDQPTVDGINTFIVSNVAARQGIKVVLSGLGGDELFGGYTSFWKAPLLSRIPWLLKWGATALPRRFFRSESERLKLLYASQGRDAADAYLLQRSLRWDSPMSGIESFGSLRDVAREMPEDWARPAAARTLSDYSRISFLESSFYMRNQLLRDSDTMSAANSIELRVPFLDLGVLESAWSIPGSQHVSPWGGGKQLLKAVLNDAIPGLPLGRRKMGFVLPWQRWLRDPEVFGMLADTMHTPSLYAGLGVTPDEGRRILAAFSDKLPQGNWLHVWSLFVLLDWKRRFDANVAKP